EVTLETAQYAVALEVLAVGRHLRGLGNRVFIFHVRCQVLSRLLHHTILNLAVRRFDKAEFVNAGIGSQRGDKTNVRAFRCFYRTHTAIVRMMYVAHFEARAVAAQTTRSEGTETTLVRQLAEGVGLIHELAELTAAEEVLNGAYQRLGI